MNQTNIRWLRSAALILLGLGLIAGALLVPSHLRAVDAAVLERAAARSPSLVDAGLAQLQLERLGPAQLLARAAEQLQVPGHATLQGAVHQFAAANPELAVWGGTDPHLLQAVSIRQGTAQNTPVLHAVLHREARTALLELLNNSRRPGVHEILANRALTNTKYFPPATSASGQPLEAVILLTALLSQGDYLSGPLREAIESAAARANRGESTEEIETIYLNLVSAARRLNWRQLTDYIGSIESPETLNDLGALLRTANGKLPVLFAVVHFSEEPRRVAAYLKRFGTTGMADLEFSLRHGRGAVRELLERQQRVYHSVPRDRVARSAAFKPMFASFVDVARYTPGLGVLLKYGFVFFGGLLLAHAARELATRSAATATGPLRLVRVPLVSNTRELLVAVLLLIFAVVFFEPFLAQDNQTREFPLRWSFPMAAETIRTTVTHSLTPLMDQLTILALALFFSVQSIIYILGLIKLAEIRRQPVSSSVKLRLLENEENLFDAGLYIGLGGTVASLVLIALGVVKPSLMAAYSSTLFGLLFVAILKICHLRPYRRQLILESEAVRA